MIGWNKAAGVLTLFGLMGLFLSPAILKPAVSAPAYGDRTVAIAIAAGPQLRLLDAPQRVESSKKTISAPERTAKSMLCGQVYRLAFADIGFRCSPNGTTTAQLSNEPSLSLAGN